MVGAIAFTRTVDASSAPSDFTSPSTPAFAVAILAWNGIPNFTAVLNNRIDGLVPFFKLVDIFESFYSSITLISKSFLKSSILKLPIGFKLIEPGQ
jgi:hypothetical protein